MPEDIKRMRYYNGLFLQEEEFQLEQDYNVRMRRIHNARLHSKGIVWGLDVVIGTIADTVIVKQGMALDYYFDSENAEYQGREIIVVADKPIDLSEYAGGDEIWLWIRYDESPAGDDPDRGEFPFNTIESFQVEHSLTRPVDEDLNIVLARIVVNPADTIDANSIRYDEAVTGNPIRFGAGFGGPRVETDVLTLRAPTIAAPWAYMTGNEFQPGGEVGINVVSERTRFTGPIDVEGDASVQNDLTVQGNATVALNAQLNGTLDVAGNVTLQQNTQVVGDLRVDGALAGRVPLGGVLAVFNYGGNIPATSTAITADGFMLADGAALPASTALHAMATANTLSTNRPDLTNDVFVMGATSSGNVGGANSVTVTIPPHSHLSDNLEITGGSTVSNTFTTSGPSGPLNSHSHGQARSPTFAPYSGGGFPVALNGFNQSDFAEQTAGPSNADHSHTVGISFNLSGLGIAGSIGTGQSGDGPLDMSANPHENRPSYVSAVYLIRVN